MTRHFGSALLVTAASFAAVAGCGGGSAPTASSTAAPASTSAAPAASSPAVSSAEPTASSSVCPVSAETLNKAPGLTPGVKMKPSTVKCWHTWAMGYPVKPVGDGFYLFRYTPGSGWRYQEQASGMVCSERGIKWDPKDPAPFCGPS